MDVTKISTEDLLKHPYVQELHQIIYQLRIDLEAMIVELRKLKKLPGKPDIKPSKLDDPMGNTPEDNTTQDNNSPKKTKRPGSDKRSKTKDLAIHEKKELHIDNVGKGWKFIGFQDYVVQDLIIKAHNICYKRAVWLTPEGKQVMASLPAELEGTHYGTSLQGFILYQYNQCQVTQPLLSEQLYEYGIDISTGQINNILNHNKQVFHEEAMDILITGLRISPEIRTDDTSAPHQKHSGYCNCINTDYFTYFKSSDSKSRINFLEILSAKNPVYVLNQETISGLQANGLGKKYMSILENEAEQTFTDKALWNIF